MHDDFRVAAWLIEPRMNTVSRKGVTVHLEPKVMQVLVCLAQHACEPVTKEQLLQAVWTNTFVTDDVLKRSISELRRVFEDDVRESRIIQTIPKSGYRLMLPIEPGDGSQSTSPASQGREPARSGRWLIPAMVATVAALMGLALTVGFPRPGDQPVAMNSPPEIHSIAVLPLENLSGDPAQEYFSDGITDGLITDLAQIGSVRVISRTSTMRYKRSARPLPEIARELNVDGIIEGTVQRVGNGVRITAQLIHCPTDRHLWANSYEGQMRDVLALEREVTGNIANQIQAKLTENRGPLGHSWTLNPKALDAYLEGNYHLSRLGTSSGDEERRKAADYFQQVIDADPNFVLGYIGLADSHAELIRGSREDAAIRRKAVERAVTLDPDSSEAHAELGDLKIENWDWQGAEKEYRQAVALNANNSAGHNGLCYLLIQLGRLDDGLRECQVSQVLDPNEDHLTSALYSRREYDRAIEVLLRMLKSHPDRGDLHYTLYASYAEKRMYKEAAQELEIAARLFGFPEIATNLHRAYANSGYSGAMREWAKAMENLVVTKQAFLSIELAETYAALGKNDRAFYWLEQAYKNHDIGSAYDVDLRVLKVEPMLDPLRSDARFKDLLRRTGLI